MTYDYSESQAPLVLEEGARIVHPSFGSGTIVAVSGSGERIAWRLRCWVGKVAVRGPTT